MSWTVLQILTTWMTSLTVIKSVSESDNLPYPTFFWAQLICLEVQGLKLASCCGEFGLKMPDDNPFVLGILMPSFPDT